VLRVIKWIPNIKEPYTLYLVFRDPRTNQYAKIYAAVIIVLVIAYTLSPFDIVPDTFPLLGWLDDLVLIPFALMFIEKILPQDILADNRKIASSKVNKAILVAVLGALALIALWATSITAMVFLILKLTSG
jgi:uncharacterized membrane protein YkvA (DUF1232 family)